MAAVAEGSNPGEAPPRPAPRGRPRDMVRSRRILDAAIQLLEQSDYQHLSIDRVAAEAGVSKATIYRWWPTKAHLGLDAVTQPALQAGPAFEPTGHLREDLVEYIAATLKLEQGREYLFRLLTNIVQIAGDVPAGDDLRMAIADAVIRHRTARVRELFENAVARGELPANADVDMMLDVFYGAAYYRALFRHTDTSRADLARIVDGVLDGFAAPHNPSGGFAAFSSGGQNPKAAPGHSHEEN